MKVVFVTFADNKFQKSLRRIESEARSFSCFTDFQIFHEEDIDKDFRKIIKPWFHRRGYGYWRWKPYFVKRVLDTLDNGDVLVWADVGCVLNKDAENKLQEYIKRAKETNSGFFVFEQEQIEKAWTKNDLFVFLKTPKEDKDTGQLWAGAWIVEKSTMSCYVIDEWYRICRNHSDLVTDKRSETPNDISFIEHRWDQSVFSLLVKTTDAIRHPYSSDSNEPIRGLRRKEKTIFVKYFNRIILPWRFALGYYLKYVKGFYFRSRVSW